MALRATCDGAMFRQVILENLGVFIAAIEADPNEQTRIWGFIAVKYVDSAEPLHLKLPIFNKYPQYVRYY
jgi:hypothetical protein